MALASLRIRKKSARPVFSVFGAKTARRLSVERVKGRFGRILSIHASESRAALVYSADSFASVLIITLSKAGDAFRPKFLVR
jgi:hypothetical protein